MELQDAEFDYEFRTGEYLSRGWELFQKNAGLFIAYGLVYLLIQSVLASFFVGVFLHGPLAAGFYIVAAKTARGEVIDFGDFFKGFERFLPLFLVGLVTNILTSIGFVLLIIPGIYLSVAYLFAIPAALWLTDDFWKSMEISRKVIGRNWFSVFGFGIVLVLIFIAGGLACGVGVIVAVPVIHCCVYAAYADVLGEGGDNNGGWSEPDVLDADYTS